MPVEISVSPDQVPANPSPGPALAGASSGPVVLDFGKLAELEQVLPVSEIADLISLFLGELDGHLQRIATHKSDGNFPDLARGAHIVVSTAGNVGAMQLSALAGKVETACTEKRTDAVPELVENRNRAAGSAAAALKAWLERRSPAPRQAA